MNVRGGIEWDRKVGVRQQYTHFLNRGFILKDYIETQMAVSIDEIIDWKIHSVILLHIFCNVAVNSTSSTLQFAIIGQT